MCHNWNGNNSSQTYLTPWLHEHNIMLQMNQTIKKTVSTTCQHHTTRPRKSTGSDAVRGDTTQKSWTCFMNIWMSHMFLEEACASLFGVLPQNSSTAKLQSACVHVASVHWQRVDPPKRLNATLDGFPTKVQPADISPAPPRGWREQLWLTCCSDYDNNLTASERRRR